MLCVWKKKNAVCDRACCGASAAINCVCVCVCVKIRGCGALYSHRAWRGATCHMLCVSEMKGGSV